MNADFYSNNYSNEDTRQNKYLDEENLCLPWNLTDHVRSRFFCEMRLLKKRGDNEGR